MNQSVKIEQIQKIKQFSDENNNNKNNDLQFIMSSTPSIDNNTKHRHKNKIN